MVSDIYTKSGTPVAFHDGSLIYDLHGRAVGQLRGSHVYCMAGHYVGELQRGVISDENCSYGSIGAYAASTGRQRTMGSRKRTRSELPRHL